MHNKYNIPASATSVAEPPDQRFLGIEADNADRGLVRSPI